MVYAYTVAYIVNLHVSVVNKMELQITAHRQRQERVHVSFGNIFFPTYMYLILENCYNWAHAQILHGWTNLLPKITPLILDFTGPPISRLLLMNDLLLQMLCFSLNLVKSALSLLQFLFSELLIFHELTHLLAKSMR